MNSNLEMLSSSEGLISFKSVRIGIEKMSFTETTQVGGAAILLAWGKMTGVILFIDNGATEISKRRFQHVENGVRRGGLVSRLFASRRNGRSITITALTLR